MTHADPNAAPPGPPHDTQTETHSEPRDHADGGHDAAGGHDEHGHDTEALGPVNWAAWGAGALGLLVAAAMVLVFAIATSPVAAS